MKAAGVRVTSRTLRYSVGPVLMPDGAIQDLPVAREKGIDLRMGLDLLRLARHGEFDCALIFSQDGDLAEVVEEIVALRQEINRWLVVDCAFPYVPGAPRGIAGARPIPFEKTLYDTCIDPNNYFPPKSAPTLPGFS